MVDIERNDKNWEAEFIDIRYSDALEIGKDTNIKETSIYYDYGESDVLSNFVGSRIHLRAYNNNALKNANLNIIDGRLPVDSNEIIISSGIKNALNCNIGDEIENNFNNEMKKFKIVGIADNMEEDNHVYGNVRYGAITYLEEKDVNPETIVNVRILVNNLKDIRKTCETLVENLHLEELQNKETQIQQEDTLGILQALKDAYKNETEKEMIETNGIDNSSKVRYNKDLLSYELVTDIDKDFTMALFISIGVITFIISMASIIIIYTSFKINYNNRIKDIGVLSSIRYE